MRALIFFIATIGLMTCASDEETLTGPESPATMPLRPDLSKLGRGELEQYFLTYENTPQRAEMDAWLRQHDMEIYRASNGMIGVAYGIEKLVYADTDSIDDLARRDLYLAQEVATALHRPDDPKAWGRCVAAWRDRGGTIPSATEYRAVAHVEAKDGIGRIALYEIRHWPDGLDEELKRCATEIRQSRTWEASKDYSLKLEMGGIVKAKAGDPCVVLD